MLNAGMLTLLKKAPPPLRPDLVTRWSGGVAGAARKEIGNMNRKDYRTGVSRTAGLGYVFGHLDFFQAPDMPALSGSRFRRPFLHPFCRYKRDTPMTIRAGTIRNSFFNLPMG